MTEQQFSNVKLNKKTPRLTPKNVTSRPNMRSGLHNPTSPRQASSKRNTSNTQLSKPRKHIITPISKGSGSTDRRVNCYY